MRTIAIINQKGGCGKTTTAINLSSMLARRGRRVLLVDMDPQSHCAAGLGIPEQRIDQDIGDAMLAAGVRTIDPARLLWRAGRNLDLAPSRMRLAGLEAARGGLNELADKELRLRAALGLLAKDYDLCCIDCPPSIGLLTYNSLAAADVVLIPVETAFFSLQGATRQVNTVKTIARRLGRSLQIWLVPTIHDDTNEVSDDLLAELGRRFKDRVSPVVIRRDVALREAASFGQAIADYAPQCPGTMDYAALATWLLQTMNEPFEADSLVETIEAGESEPAAETRTNNATSQPVPEVQASDEAVPVDRPGVSAAGELKPVSRAEDVARRAQEFLRRVAVGKAVAMEALASSPALPEPEPTTAVRLVTEPRVVAVSPSPSVQRLFGARQTNQGVLFVQPITSGMSVSVAGAFNGWSSTTHVMRRNPELGVFELCLPLPPGRHLYRLVVDGQWTADPYNDTCEPNPFGDTNSVILVGSGDRAEVPA
ncbi:MAG: AAA family ATPase [Phycisphaerales bacterium]|nr:AAA family ATPase [Phycisphaerales bacterium]